MYLPDCNKSSLSSYLTKTVLITINHVCMTIITCKVAPCLSQVEEDEEREEQNGEKLRGVDCGEEMKVVEGGGEMDREEAE